MADEVKLWRSGHIGGQRLCPAWITRLIYASADCGMSYKPSEASPQTTHKHPLSSRDEAIGQRPVAENPEPITLRPVVMDSGFASAPLRRPGIILPLVNLTHFINFS